MIKDIKKMRNERGFTLIELLVVIVILGILAAVVVFAVGGLSDKGESSACKIDTRTLRTAEEAFFAKYSVYAVPDTAVDINQDGTVDTAAPESATTPGEDKLVAAKLLAQPASAYHDIAVGTDGDPYDIVTANPATSSSVKCADPGTAPGTKVDGDAVK